ncbi:MAG: 2-oxo acid dehydrogenase subunit E2 [Planctomycetes bacterium]|nr:2-oxo acid dehydrogenase subunit E2 [Planctomycetota bacterium]
MAGYRVLDRNPFFETMCEIVKDWETEDVVMFSNTVDLSRAVEQRKALRKAGRMPPTYTAYMVRAISLALRDHPKINRLVWRLPLRKRLVQLEDVHAAVAVERPGDEVDMAFPTIVRDSDRRSSLEIAEALRKASATDPENDPTWRKFRFLLRHLPAWANRRLIGMPVMHPKLWMEHHGGSFLITSPAKYGVDRIFVKVAWPLAFSFGEVKERPVAVDGRVEARTTTDLTLSWQRRLTTGAVAAQFFNSICRRLRDLDLDEQLLSETPHEAAALPAEPVVRV